MDLEKLVLPLSVADDAFKAGIGAAVAGVGALVGAMGVAVKDTFDWANQLDSIGDVMGVTDKEAAALNFTLRKSGTNTDTLTKGMVILSKGLIKADGTLDTTGRALKDWGINVTNANGELKDQSALLGDVTDRYSQFGTQQEKINFLTEVFGRNGAELIDFFDTLAGEGGINAVTKKVEALGLAIDSGRYEQFNRNLEELKMIGLGLAVSFTENVMPLVEKFVGWLGDVAQSQEWADFKQGFGNFVSGISTAIGEGDWETVKNILFEKLDQFDDWLAEKFDAMDWTGAGASFGAALDKILQNGIDTTNAKLPDSLQSLFTGIDQFFQAAVGADQFGGWKNYFFVWGQQIDAGFKATSQNWEITMNNFWLKTGQSISAFFTNLISSWSVGISNWGISVYNKVIEWVNKIITAFNRVSQFISPGAYQSAIPLAGAGNVRTHSGRASGGPVIKGQTYNVTEFFRPEKFTPSTNGRVDPMDNNSGGIWSQLTFVLQQFADEIARSNRVAFEKAGRR